MNRVLESCSKQTHIKRSSAPCQREESDGQKEKMKIIPLAKTASTRATDPKHNNTYKHERAPPLSAEAPKCWLSTIRTRVSPELASFSCVGYKENTKKSASDPQGAGRAVHVRAHGNEGLRGSRKNENNINIYRKHLGFARKRIWLEVKRKQGKKDVKVAERRAPNLCQLMSCCHIVNK